MLENFKQTCVYDQSTFFALAAFREPDGVPPLCSNYRFALVAQWIAHQTSNLGVAGSNPVEHVFEWAVGLVV